MYFSKKKKQQKKKQNKRKLTKKKKRLFLKWTEELHNICVSNVLKTMKFIWKVNRQVITLHLSLELIDLLSIINQFNNDHQLSRLFINKSFLLLIMWDS